MLFRARTWRQPNRTILITSIIVLIAALVGGDFRALGFQFPDISLLVRWLLGFLALGLFILSFFLGTRPTHPKQEAPASKPSGPVDLPISRVEYVPRTDPEGNDLVASITEALSAAGGPILLWGAGGVGKTTIGSQTAREWRAKSGGLVLYVSAEAHAHFTRTTLLDDLVSQLGHTDLRSLEANEKEERLRGLVSEISVLIVVDNIELAERDEQDICLTLLDRLPCQSLVISRDRSERGRLIQVGDMSREEGEEFIQRLVATTQNQELLESLNPTDIIRAADGNPMATEWIIAQIDLAQLPAEVLQDVREGKGSAAQRIFKHSLSLPQVGEDERLTLFALGLFSPDASRPALAHVAGLAENLDRLTSALERLSALRLVQMTAGGDRVAVTGLTRDLVRAELAGSDEEPELKRRFVGWYHRFLEESND